VAETAAAPLSSSPRCQIPILRLATGFRNSSLEALVFMNEKWTASLTGWGAWSACFAHPALRALAWVTAGLAELAIFSGASLWTASNAIYGTIRSTHPSEVVSSPR
jgi:hypothetical protein